MKKLYRSTGERLTFNLKDGRVSIGYLVTSHARDHEVLEQCVIAGLLTCEILPEEKAAPEVVEDFATKKGIMVKLPVAGTITIKDKVEVKAPEKKAPAKKAPTKKAPAKKTPSRKRPSTKKSR